MYKIKVYKHTSLKTQVDDDFPKVVAYFKSDFVKRFITLDVVFDIESTDVPMNKAPYTLFMPNDGKYDLVMYMFERGTFPMASLGLTFDVSKTLRATYLACDPLDDGVNYTYVSICHEILHALEYKVMDDHNLPLKNVLDNPVVNGKVVPFYGNDQPYLEGGNYYQQLQYLSTYLNKSMYTYFKDSEVIGLKPEFVALLDKARGIAGVPFKITSGLRSVSINESVGGVPDSSHLLGLAVDLAVLDGVSGGKILLALAQVGLNRFGFYQDNHLHVDMDTSKPGPCYWVK